MVKLQKTKSQKVANVVETVKSDIVVDQVVVKLDAEPVLEPIVLEPIVLEQLVVNDVENIVHKKKRSFKAIYMNLDDEIIQEGRYCGKKPKQSACKALTAIYKKFNKFAKENSKKKVTIPTIIKFGVVETTRGSKNKKYWYSGERTQLDKPVQVEIIKNGQSNPIIYKHSSVIKKISETECQNLVNFNVKLDDEPLDEDKKVAKIVKTKKVGKKLSKKSGLKQEKVKKNTSTKVKKSKKSKTLEPVVTVETIEKLVKPTKKEKVVKLKKTDSVVVEPVVVDPVVVEPVVIEPVVIEPVVVEPVIVESVQKKSTKKVHKLKK
jgi:hypothetical protein